MNGLRRVVWAIGIAIFGNSVCSADYLLYSIPGIDAQVIVQGRCTVNVGGTVSCRHPRGTLHFKSEEIKLIQTPEPRELFVRKLRLARRSEDVDELIEVARWALRNGLLKECKRTLSEAWALDSSHEHLRKLAYLVSYLGRTAKFDDSVEQHARDFVGGRDMQVLKSKHFLLLHNAADEPDHVTGQTRAEMRLELLEKVYEYYFLTFGLAGHFMRPPERAMEVVLFGEHRDYLHFVTTKDPALKQAAGFYLPGENISVFYDQATSEAFQGLAELERMIASGLDEARRQRPAGSGYFIRFAKTIQLMLDIVREEEDVATVSHEATHQLAANSGLFPRDGAFVRWIHEGLASYFETPQGGSWNGVGTVDEDRIGYYRVLEGHPVQGSLDFIVSDRGFLNQQNQVQHLAAYGQAWSLTHFLFETRFDELIKFYAEATALPGDWTTDRPDELLQAFDRAFGDRVALELEWRRYMRGLRTDIERLVAEGRL